MENKRLMNQNSVNLLKLQIVRSGRWTWREKGEKKIAQEKERKIAQKKQKRHSAAFLSFSLDFDCLPYLVSVNADAG